MTKKSLHTLALIGLALTASPPSSARPIDPSRDVRDKSFTITARCADGTRLTSPVQDWPTICSGRGGTMFPFPFIDPMGGAGASPRSATLLDDAVRATAALPRAVPGRSYSADMQQVFIMPPGATAQYYIPGYIKGGYIRCGDGISILIGNLHPALHAGMCIGHGGFVGYADYPEPDKIKL